MSDRHSQSILCLEGVSLQATVGSYLLLEDISCDFISGSKVGIVGASGAGKTSLLRLLNSLVVPTQGEIYLQGRSVQQIPPTQLRKSIVLVPQEPKLLGMQVTDALAYPLKLQQLPDAEIRGRIDTWIGLLKIQEEWLNKTELQLSLGQRQLVAIARALVMQPQVLLLDEPTSALDMGNATNLLQVLTELNRTQDTTIIMVNHQLDLIKDFCDRLLLLNAGKLEANLLAQDINWQTLQQKIVGSRLKEEQDW